MQKVNALFKTNNNDSQFNKLVAQADVHLTLQQFWEAIAPKNISQSSFAGNLNNGLLTIYAYNNSVAAKIRLSNASLLTQLQKLQKTDPLYKQCKVTAIKVKVQVKSQHKHASVEPRIVSRRAATTLRSLAKNLGDSSLADKLNKIADNA